MSNEKIILPKDELEILSDHITKMVLAISNLNSCFEKSAVAEEMENVLKSMIRLNLKISALLTDIHIAEIEQLISRGAL